VLGNPRFSKRTWAGVRERVTILQAHGLDPWAWESAGWAAVDDTLDAAAAAITAMRYGEHRAIAYPADRTQPCIWA
jgi:hypothetical protein